MALLLAIRSVAPAKSIIIIIIILFTIIRITAVDTGHVQIDTL